MRPILLAGIVCMIAVPAFAHEGVNEKQLVEEAEIAAAIKLIGPPAETDPAKLGQKSLFGFAIRWENGKTVTVCMWHQDVALRALIATVAMEWMQDKPNIKLDFGDMTNPRQCSGTSTEDIRVADDPASPLSPFWSVLGSQAKGIGAGQPTMDLGFGGAGSPLAKVALDAVRNHDATFRNYLHFVVLHEFGHALGALHEHQWGTCARFLNEARAVEEEFPSATTPALKQQALDNLRALTQTQTDAWGAVRLTKAEDPDSVMRYFFPSDIYQKVGGEDPPKFCSNQFETFASKADLAGLRIAYPQPGDAPGPAAAAVVRAASALASDAQNDLTPAARSRIADIGRAQAPGPAAAAAAPAAPPPPLPALPSKAVSALNSLLSAPSY